MNPIFKKLNFKDQAIVCVLNAPDSFLPAIEEMASVTKVDIKYSKSKNYPFVLFFAENEDTFKTIVNKISPTLETEDDLIFWVAYPKKSSKKFKSDINRDSDAWLLLGEFNFEGVRQVAIDEDWSALRFRKVNFINKQKYATSFNFTLFGLLT